MARDETQMNLMRSANHADKRGYKEFSKKMRDQSE